MEQEGIVWLLLKGLCGLKQADRIWHERPKDDMEELGFLQCQRDRAVFRIGDWGLGRRRNGSGIPSATRTRSQEFRPEVWDLPRG